MKNLQRANYEFKQQVYNKGYLAPANSFRAWFLATLRLDVFIYYMARLWRAVKLSIYNCSEALGLGNDSKSHLE